MKHAAFHQETLRKLADSERAAQNPPAVPVVMPAWYSAPTGPQEALNRIEAGLEEVSAGLEEVSARQNNGLALERADSLHSFRLPDGGPAPGTFPSTLGSLVDLSSESLKELLLAYSLSVGGSDAVLRRRFRQHIGVPKFTAP